MKIGLLLAESRGGIGQHVASLVPRYLAAGHEVVVCAPPGTAEHFDFGAATVVAQAPALRGSDVIHAHGYRAGMAALRDRANLRPLVVSWHNAVIAAGPRGLVMRLGQRLVAKGADLTLGASSDLVELAKSLGARDARLAPVAAPAVPQAAVSAAAVREELGLAPEQPLVLTVGRLAPQKDYPTLLSVAASVRESTPDAVFVVVGDGPLRDNLQARIDAEQLPVRLVGHRSDVADLLNAADVFLLTSHWEARALVIQEAMQVGVPVVATAVGGIPELVDDSAVLAFPGDSDGLADGVRAVLAEPETANAMRTRGRELAAGWPGEDAVAKNLLDIYAGLVATTP
ncbi:glycosyltransferase family 4 protein [Kribbella sandramycini]|uniref:Glycosyltransferase family 4 protein n=1 Tax=Kribbella sandramycini TaxID=60450 RepID=A0A7Y4L600_9ACTN|nr:glycosyltransferase family 4 protein [Kribbella sandramycini]MBB6570937.1 glycosyltransferase involved in cell wall biosynthesis [Kribbella sandramycini]NOL44067.1 glycosyltransferase family 4 protein [Kribbella sandramycini]